MPDVVDQRRQSQEVDPLLGEALPVTRVPVEGIDQPLDLVNGPDGVLEAEWPALG